MFKVQKLDHKALEMLPIKEVSVEWDLSKRNNSESSDDSFDDNCWITFLWVLKKCVNIWFVMTVIIEIE